MITRGLVWALGWSQLLCWGISYYVIAVFAEPIAAETGWSLPLIHGGFSAALVTMGIVSSRIGRLVEEHGGRPVMVAGSVLIALGCLGLSASRSLPVYYGAWIVLGLAMRMSLYDAAFAALARIGGREARRSISQITLLGGLASTVLWPVGQALTDAFGWRLALVCYAAIALLTIPLHLMIPAHRHGADTAAGPPPIPPRAVTPREQRIAGLLFGVGLTLNALLASAMSAHMIGLLSGLGLALAAAVWVSALRGVGQSAARLAEILFGRRLDPLVLGVVAAGLLPIGFLFGLYGGVSLAAALAFSLVYGAGNGLATIVRGTQPLVLFDPATYGSVVGRLVSPSFYVSAAAPLAFAWIVERYGEAAALWLAVAISLLVLGCASALFVIFRRRDDNPRTLRPPETP